jgi:YggT family protein
VTAFVAGALVAGTHWAVRARRLNAFGAWPRLVRRASDPLLRPLERRVVRMGGNPQDAPFWLLGAIVLGGLVVLGLFRWSVGFVESLRHVSGGGPRYIAAAVVRTVVSILQIALLVRVIGSWLGLSYARWMRPVHALTNWIVNPLRRVVPTIGPIDITPLVAWFVLIIAERLLIGLLVG